MRSLVDAALLDQEQRILAISPLEILGRKGGGRKNRAPKPLSEREAVCEGGCGKRSYRSNLRGKPTYTCAACRGWVGRER